MYTSGLLSDTSLVVASLTRLRDEEEKSVGTKSLLSSLERAEVSRSGSSVKGMSLAFSYIGWIHFYETSWSSQTF